MGWRRRTRWGPLTGPHVAAEHVLAPTHAVEHERRAFVDLAEEEPTWNRQRQEEGDTEEA